MGETDLATIELIHAVLLAWGVILCVGGGAIYLCETCCVV